MTVTAVPTEGRFQRSLMFIFGLMVVGLLVAGCGGAQPATLDTGTPSSFAETPTESTTRSPTPTPTAEPSTTATAEPSTMPQTAGCEDGPTGTYLDTVWTDSVSDDVAFLSPKDWADLSGFVDHDPATLLAGDTLAELGVESDAKLKAQFVRHTAGFPNFSVFRFESSEASSLDLADIYAREEARYAALPDVIELLDTEIEECLDGEPALGLALTFSAGGDQVFQVSFFTEHDGAIYHLQWLAEDPDSLDLLDEMLGSWHWASPEDRFEAGSDDGSESDARVLEAHVGSVAPAGDDDPDPSTFSNSVPSDADQICVFTRLDVGEADTALVTWYVEGAPVFEQDRKIEDVEGWARWCIETSTGGFDTGNWAVFVEFAGSGDRKVVSFKVVD